MLHRFFTLFRRSHKHTLIEPDEIFLDSSNLPQFDTHQFEGRIERPISKNTFLLLGVAIFMIVLLLTGRLWMLQVVHGSSYSERSEENRLQDIHLFAERGLIYDRNGVELAWNTPNSEGDFAIRTYTSNPGFGHLLGFAQLPQQDSSGNFFETETIGLAGVEQTHHETLKGQNGSKLVETDALGEILSESVAAPPEDGYNVTLSIDADLQEAMHTFIKNVADEQNYIGGAGVIMNVNNGEVLAMVNYPEYDSNVLTRGADTEAIASYAVDERKPYLDRVVTGLYTPGSTMKLFVALGALGENVIDPATSILSTGELLLPNPFVPDTFTRFLDWKAHGYVDMRQAIAVSSNVYFYHIGGGFGDQRGIGISKIEEYVRKFGFGTETQLDTGGEALGTIPNPEWKREHFDGDDWRLGDTYNTSIGQYGFQVTPLQLVRGIAAIANGGTVVEPKLISGSKVDSRRTGIPVEHIDIVRDGMRLAVTEGSAVGLSNPNVAVAAKTGTAQVGAQNQFSNAWVVGFFPADDPTYAFTVLMDRAPAGTAVGGVSVMRQTLDWMAVNTPEYLE